MRTHPIPERGDTVVLNDTGLRQIFNHAHGLGHMKTLKMKIVWVDDTSMTDHSPTFAVSVDHPEINAYLIDHLCFDVVEKGVKAGSLSTAASSRGRSSVRYEEWSGQNGRGGLQRTLDPTDAADAAFLADGISIVDDNGNERPPTMAEADAMGIRRIVTARKIMPDEDWS